MCLSEHVLSAGCSVPFSLPSCQCSHRLRMARTNCGMEQRAQKQPQLQLRRSPTLKYPLLCLVSFPLNLVYLAIFCPALFMLLYHDKWFSKRLLVLKKCFLFSPLVVMIYDWWILAGLGKWTFLGVASPCDAFYHYGVPSFADDVEETDSGIAEDDEVCRIWFSVGCCDLVQCMWCNVTKCSQSNERVPVLFYLCPFLFTYFFTKMVC